MDERTMKSLSLPVSAGLTKTKGLNLRERIFFHNLTEKISIKQIQSVIKPWFEEIFAKKKKTGLDSVPFFS